MKLIVMTQNDRLQRFRIVDDDSPGRGKTVAAENIRSLNMAQGICDLVNGQSIVDSIQNTRLKVIIAEREQNFDKLVRDLTSVFNPRRTCIDPSDNSTECQLDAVREILDNLTRPIE